MIKLNLACDNLLDTEGEDNNKGTKERFNWDGYILASPDVKNKIKI